MVPNPPTHHKQAVGLMFLCPVHRQEYTDQIKFSFSDYLGIVSKNRLLMLSEFERIN